MEKIYTAGKKFYTAAGSDGMDLTSGSIQKQEKVSPHSAWRHDLAATI